MALVGKLYEGLGFLGEGDLIKTEDLRPKTEIRDKNEV